MVTTEQLIEVVNRAPNSLGRGLDGWLREEVDKLGAAAEVVPVAAAGMAADDRNVRVKMLRVLALYGDPVATAAVLRSLRDPARRVRKVAINAIRPNHVTDEVVDRLRAIVDDDEEINSLRRDAFFVLSQTVANDAVAGVTLEAVREMVAPTQSRIRLPMLVRLCKSANHSDAARTLLQDFVDNGTKEEAVMATRALCGQMLVRVDGWLPNDVRKRVRATYDAAPGIAAWARVPPATFGSPSVWIPRDEALALAAEVGYPHPV